MAQRLCSRQSFNFDEVYFITYAAQLLAEVLQISQSKNARSVFLMFSMGLNT